MTRIKDPITISPSPAKQINRENLKKQNSKIIDKNNLINFQTMHLEQQKEEGQHILKKIRLNLKQQMRSESFKFNSTPDVQNTQITGFPGDPEFNKNISPTRKLSQQQWRNLANKTILTPIGIGMHLGLMKKDKPLENSAQEAQQPLSTELEDIKKLQKELELKQISHKANLDGLLNKVNMLLDN